MKDNEIGSHNHGLINGHIGISIFYYHLARKTGNSEYEKLADELLDKAYANLSSSTPLDFENGLAGVGWGIEYLVQNKFAEGNTDETLEEIDNKLFRSLNEEVHTSIELTTGLTGYLFYLINRLKNRDTPASMTERINRELLIQTINRIDELVPSQFPSIVKDGNFDLFWRFPCMLASLHEAYKLNFYNEKIKCMLKQWLPFFEAYIPSLHINRLFIAIALKQLCCQIPDNRLEKQIKILLFSIDFEILKTEIDYSLINIRIGWPGVALLLHIALKEIEPDFPNYNLIGQTYLYIIERQKGQLENLQQDMLYTKSIQPGLALGLSGLGLLELLWPGVLTGSEP